MKVPMGALFGRGLELPEHEELEDDDGLYRKQVTCLHCGAERLHWEEWRTSRQWTLVNSLGDVHECPPIDASSVFSNLDEVSEDERLPAELG